MHRLLLKKAIRDSRLLFVCCAVWLFAFSWMRVWIVSRMERSRFQAIIEQLGDLLSTFSPVPLSHLLSFTGRIGWGYDEPMLFLVLLAFSITRGSDVVSGELNRGTLEMLLAQPIARWKIIVSQGFITTFCLAMLSLSTWLGVYTGVHTTQAKIEKTPEVAVMPGISFQIPFTKPTVIKVPMHTRVEVHHFWPAAVNLFCLGFCFAGVVTLSSSADRYRWRTVGFAITGMILQMVLKLLCIVNKDWRWLRYTTIFNAYEPQRFIEAATRPEGEMWSWYVAASSNAPAFYGPLSCYSVLLGIGLLSYVAAIVIFTRRDIPAP